MSKRNKIRYQSTPKKRVAITLTGQVYLMYRDEEAIAAAQKGDVMFYPRCDALHDLRCGEYERTGLSGYFKLDVFDGKSWQPVLTQDIFPASEHHFAKSERPFDTYLLCESMVKALAGATLVRTYREHYELEEEAPPA